MPTLVITGRDGLDHVVEARTGASVMQAISDAGVTDLFAICNGCCICATCHVHVDPASAKLLPPLADEERALLQALTHRRETSRLSCQLSVTPQMDGLRLAIAPEE
jgi:2Fe-2S ferredoxin